MIFDIIIVGGGIIGLSTFHMLLNKFPQKDILLVEKENKIGLHQTGRNSGVIHSGIYYKPGSLKAKNCRYGSELLKKFCQKHSVKFEMCGKIIVASDISQIEQLKFLLTQGEKNGIKGLRLLEKNEIIEFEPHAVGEGAIFCPETGIVDYSEICRKLKMLILNNGGKIITKAKVLKIENKIGEIIISTNKNEYKTKFLINCCGLFSDKVAKLSGVKLETKIVPFKGEYYSLKNHSNFLVKNLIYPLPDPLYPFLGVHLTRTINGEIHAGPNAVLAMKREGYGKYDLNFNDIWDYASFPGFWRMAKKYWYTGLREYYRSFSKKSFLKSLQRLVPEITYSDIQESPCGIRAQALGLNGKLIDDFVIKESQNMIHVINAPSPAATSSLAIAKQITKIYHSQRK